MYDLRKKSEASPRKNCLDSTLSIIILQLELPWPPRRVVHALPQLNPLLSKPPPLATMWNSYIWHTHTHTLTHPLSSLSISRHRLRHSRARRARIHIYIYIILYRCMYTRWIITLRTLRRVWWRRHGGPLSLCPRYCTLLAPRPSVVARRRTAASVINANSQCVRRMRQKSRETRFYGTRIAWLRRRPPIGRIRRRRRV